MCTNEYLFMFLKNLAQYIAIYNEGILSERQVYEWFSSIKYFEYQPRLTSWTDENMVIIFKKPKKTDVNIDEHPVIKFYQKILV